jgi:hypothetical protein
MNFTEYHEKIKDIMTQKDELVYKHKYKVITKKEYDKQMELLENSIKILENKIKGR